MIEIIWTGKSYPKHEQRIRDDVDELLSKGLGGADDLMTHLVEIGTLDDGPLISIHGDSGKIVAEYIDRPVWKSISVSGDDGK